MFAAIASAKPGFGGTMISKKPCSFDLVTRQPRVPSRYDTGPHSTCNPNDITTRLNRHQHSLTTTKIHQGVVFMDLPSIRRAPHGVFFRETAWYFSGHKTRNECRRKLGNVLYATKGQEQESCGMEFQLTLERHLLKWGGARLPTRLVRVLSI